MLPNIPVKFRSSQEYIEFLAGIKDEALFQVINTELDIVRGDIQTLKLDSESLSENIASHADVAANVAHRKTITGNPHQVTKAQVGLSLVPNHDFTEEVNANTAKVGITTQQTQDILDNNAHRGDTTTNPHSVTKAQVGLGSVPNTDFTASVTANTAHKNTATGNPHQVTKAEVGLGAVPNHNFTVEVNANTAHKDTATGNPHQVTKAEVGLSEVPNVDCTNASNITSGILPNHVLPSLAITDVHVVDSELEHLALTKIYRGDVVVRTDLPKTFINIAGANNTMEDWQPMLTPTDSILSVNGQTGVVVLTTTSIDEGTNLYYTEARVQANADVAANTAARHGHTNKSILDATSASYTTDDVDTLAAADTHRTTTTGNPHQVTKTDVGLSEVPNVDATNASNIASGTLPSSVLPPIAIDSFVADSETEMLELNTKLSDRCYRTDLEVSYINVTGTNGALTDWRPLSEVGTVDLDNLRTEFDAKLLEQEDRLIAMIAALS